MAKNINFIPAAELPEAIGDDVSVICLENGELKQKPGASIGGKGWDMRIRYNLIDRSYEIVDGTYQQIISKINNDVSPTIYCIQIHTNYKSIYHATATYNTNLNTITVSGGGLIFEVSPDNSIILTD